MSDVETGTETDTEPDTETGAVQLDERVRAMLDGRNFAVLCTAGPGGAPHSATVWVARDGDALLFTSATARQKVRNIRREPRVSVSIYALADPYTSAEIRGTAELVPDPDKRLPYDLSHHYLGTDPPADEPGVERVVIRVTPTKVTVFVAP